LTCKLIFRHSYSAESVDYSRRSTYILEDEEIRDYLKIPNETTLKALSENKSNMPVFTALDDLREDLLT
jgi:hypothetical protein